MRYVANLLVALTFVACGADKEPAPAVPTPPVASSAPPATTAVPAATLTAEFVAPPSAMPAAASTIAIGAMDPVGDPADEALKPLVVQGPPVRLSSGDTLATPCYETKGYFKHRVNSESGKNPLFQGSVVKLPTLDLDGDGKVDKFIVLGASADTYDVLVLLAKGTCVVPVAAISAFDEVRALRTSHHGLRDLASGTRCEEFGRCDVEWRFDGKAYNQANAKKSKHVSKNQG